MPHATRTSSAVRVTHDSGGGQSDLLHDRLGACWLRHPPSGRQEEDGADTGGQGVHGNVARTVSRSVMCRGCVRKTVRKAGPFHA